MHITEAGSVILMTFRFHQIMLCDFGLTALKCGL